MQANLPDWAECLFREEFRYIAAAGGRGSGKSRSVATALVVRAAAKPLRVLCAREVQRSIKDSVKRLLDDEIARLGLESFYTSTEAEIRGRNGSLFLFAGLRTNVDSIKSMEGIDICWVEEAQAVSQGSLDVLIPTIRKPGSQLVFTWNPRLATDPVDVMFADPPPRSIVKRVNYDQNPWFPDVLKQEMEYDKRRDPDKYAHVWLGQYQQNSEARVFSNWKVEDFEIDPNWTLRQGADWGFSVDPSVLVQCAIVGRTLYVAHEAYRVGCDIDFLPELFGQVPESERWPTIADSSRPETISYMQRHGYKKMLPAIKGPRSVEEGIEFLRSFDIIVHPRCIHTIQELTAYSYETDAMTGLVIPRLKDKDNHVIDSLRYACEGARRAAKTVAKLDFSKSEAQGLRA